MKKNSIEMGENMMWYDPGDIRKWAVHVDIADDRVCTVAAKTVIPVEKPNYTIDVEKDNVKIKKFDFRNTKYVR